MRHNPEVRYEMIVTAAILDARKPGGWFTLTREGIARTARCSPGLVSLYLGDMDQVRATVMDRALSGEILEILIQSMVGCDGYSIPRRLKVKALHSLLGV